MCEITYVIFLLLPIRKLRQLLVWFGKTSLYDYMIHMAKIVTPFIMLFLADSCYRLLKIHSGEQLGTAATKPGNLHLVEATKFAAERNIYLTGFTMLLGAIVFQLQSLISSIEDLSDEVDELYEEEEENVVDQETLEQAVKDSKIKIAALSDMYEESVQKLKAFDNFKNIAKSVDDQYAELNKNYTELEFKYNKVSKSDAGFAA